VSSEATDRIRRRAEDIRRAELRTAIDRLETHGELTESQRAAVEALSQRLVEQLLGVAERQLETADEETVETAIELLG